MPDRLATGDVQASQTVPVIEEQLEVDRVAIDRGGWRIAKHVATTIEAVDEELRDFKVEIERRKIGTHLEGLEVPAARYEGDTLVIPVVEEVLVTEKRLLLVEEVRITGVRGTHRRPQRVSLRKESVSVERLEPEAPAARNR